MASALTLKTFVDGIESASIQKLSTRGNHVGEYPGKSKSLDITRRRKLQVSHHSSGWTYLVIGVGDGNYFGNLGATLKMLCGQCMSKFGRRTVSINWLFG